MIYFLYGPDTFRARSKLNEIITEYRKIHTSGVNCIRFDAKQNPFDEFKIHTRTISMFDEKKLIILENVFGNASWAKELFEYLEGSSLEKSSDIILVVREGALDTKQKKESVLFKKLKEIAKTQEFPMLSGAKLASWIRREIEKRGMRFSEDAETYLTRAVEGDLWRFENELEKLRAFAGGNVITRDMVERFVKPKTDLSIFKTIDAILEGNSREALKLLGSHLDRGESPLALLSMITFQIRNIVLVKDLEETKHIPFRELSRHVSIHPFVIKKSHMQAQRFGVGELRRMYEKLLDVDLDIKLGRKSPRLALELFLVSVSGN